MTTIRTKKKRHNFVIIDKTILEDARLSYKARGLAAMLLCKPDEWDVTIDYLVKSSDKDGKEAVQSAIKELEAIGYVARYRKRDEKSQIHGWEFLLFETLEDASEWHKENPGVKLVHQPNSDDGVFPSSGKPSDGKPSDGKPSDGKPADIINNIDPINDVLNNLSLISQGEEEQKTESTQHLENPVILNDCDRPEKEEDCAAPRQVEAVTSSDNAPAKKHFSSAEKCDAVFQPLPGWRNSKKRNDYLSSFVDYLIKVYLPSTSFYQGKDITEAIAKGWIVSREYDEKGISALEIQWEAFQAWQKEQEDRESAPQYEVIPTTQAKVNYGGRFFG